jgi:hypothetical protein
VRARALVIAWLLAGCGHAPQGRWDATANRLCAGATCYRVGALGPAWRLVHVERASAGFHSERLGAVIQSNATCRDDAEAAPLIALTNNLLIGYTDRRLLERDSRMLDGREALHSVVEARLDGVPVVLELFVLKRNGCVFDLSYAAPPESRPEGEPDFERFVAGFADERPV